MKVEKNLNIKTLASVRSPFCFRREQLIAFNRTLLNCLIDICAKSFTTLAYLYWNRYALYQTKQYAALKITLWFRIFLIRWRSVLPSLCLQIQSLSYYPIILNLIMMQKLFDFDLLSELLKNDWVNVTCELNWTILFAFKFWYYCAHKYVPNSHVFKPCCWFYYTNMLNWWSRK